MLQFINRKHEVTKEIKKRTFQMNDRSKVKARRKLIETAGDNATSEHLSL